MDNGDLTRALWRIYNRPERPEPWDRGGNLPWNDPAFSERMLREHLDDAHGAASRPAAERQKLVTWLWEALALQPDAHVLDVTCGPGVYAVELARRGAQVTGVDFGPAAIAYARDLAKAESVADGCTFIEADVREHDFGRERFDAALFLYGQLAVFPKEQAQDLLARIALALRAGGHLCVELLNQKRVDKEESTWWFTDDSGLWGDAPFLNLGERFWYEEEQLSCERYTTLHLETGELEEIVLCDQTYAVAEMAEMLRRAGFGVVEVYPSWDDLDVSDAEEWVTYVARK
ncbi:MAG: class I SAM-dependent methyltransferase [Candidatus Promineifilaceae bacterium]|nr:class I SAM-dependent methyltransferase [Candidatus Promineifilaceae bacterium]